MSSIKKHPHFLSFPIGKREKNTRSNYSNNAYNMHAWIPKLVHDSLEKEEIEKNIMASMQKAPLRLHVDRFRRVGPVREGGGSRRVAMKASFNTVKGNRVNGIVHIDGIEKRNGGDAVANREYLLGGFAEDRFVYRQSFVIRSYEIGPDKTATMETLMNLLQV